MILIQVIRLETLYPGAATPQSFYSHVPYLKPHLGQLSPAVRLWSGPIRDSGISGHSVRGWVLPQAMRCCMRQRTLWAKVREVASGIPII